MALRDRLDVIRSEFEEQLDLETRTAMEVAARNLSLSGIRRTALSTGAIAPLFNLVAANGGQVRLAALLGRGPVVISFHRGDWCPYCRAELDHFSNIASLAATFSASLVAISPQSPKALRPEAGIANLAFPVLSDPGARTADAYGIAFEVSEALRPIYNRFGHELSRENGTGWVLPVPATYIVEQSGRVALSYINPDYRSRLEPDAVLTALRGLSDGRRRTTIPRGNSLYEAGASTSIMMDRSISPSSEQDEETTL